MADFDDIIQEINENIPDNNTQAITAKKLRDTLVDLTDAIETQHSEFEDGIQTQQSGFETNITNRQEAFENDVDEQLSSINTQFATGQNIGDVGIDDEPTAGSDNIVKSGGVYSFARNYKGVLTASTDNIDNIREDSTYTLNTTLVSGTLPDGITTYASLTTFGYERFSYQILTETSDSSRRRSWLRTSIGGTSSLRYSSWLEITWNNLYNGRLTAESNINTLTKSGHYVIPTNTTPQGTLPTDYDNTKVGYLFHMNGGGNTNAVYAQILIQDTVSWIRNYAGNWIKITTPDLVQTITDNRNTIPSSHAVFDYAKNFKTTLTADDNIDNLKAEGTYLVNTTTSGGTYPSDIATYAILSVFGTGNYIVQFISETGTGSKSHSWVRTFKTSSFSAWSEISWNNIDNGLLSASDNIDTLKKSGGYVIPNNTTPQGTLPPGFKANNKIANLFVLTNSNNLYLQIFYKATKCWIRNYNTGWVEVAQDLSSYLKYNTTLTANDDIDSLSGQGSYLVNTTLTPGTYPTGIGTYAMLIQSGTGNYWIQILSQATNRKNATTWIRTKPGATTFNDWIQITNKPTPEPVDPSQPLYGKKIVFFGDSVTEGSAAGAQGQINNYPQFVATRTGATITNVGIGGTQMANHVAAPDYNPFSFCNLVTAITTNVWTTQDEKASVIGKTTQLAALKALDLSTYDYCVIAYGQNDRSNGVVVGNANSTDNDEFYGALNNSINALLTAYPNLHIIYVAPYNRMSAQVDRPMLPFVNAILDVAEKWAMPAINLYKISGINAKTVGTYLEDGLHPKLNSKYGYEFIGNVIGAQILSYI